jgi:putative heme iron utilization protein
LAEFPLDASALNASAVVEPEAIAVTELLGLLRARHRPADLLLALATCERRRHFSKPRAYFYLFVGCFSSLSQVEPALSNFEQNNFVVIITERVARPTAVVAYARYSFACSMNRERLMERTVPTVRGDNEATWLTN